MKEYLELFLIGIVSLVITEFILGDIGFWYRTMVASVSIVIYNWVRFGG